uniref:Immunoglobulin V-set domain-containing protein n=1 Tax=Lates calcarifer TaxID=8187 RepID=A0A4W6EBC4_LATCA
MTGSDVPQTLLNLSLLKLMDQTQFSIFHKEAFIHAMDGDLGQISSHLINRATESDSGDYRCKARSEYFLTEWSDKVRLTVSRKLKHLSFKVKMSCFLMFSFKLTFCLVSCYKLNST